jgi:uncharacterized protein
MGKNLWAFFLVVFVLFLSLFSSLTLADDSFHLPLLAVQETVNGSYLGGVADLYLELQPGSGRVFLDTSPLTKVDTQASTRYAKGIACDYFELDCDNYDFIYTIKAKSNIIGGPSAGAAIAALTALAILDVPYNENVAITGTINSGGVIGPVGGVKEKIKAAEKNKLAQVLVPLGSLDAINNNSNLSNSNLFDNPNENNSDSEIEIINKVGQIAILNPFSTITPDFEIPVKEVSDLNSIVFELSSKNLKPESSVFEVDTNYNQIMHQLDELLCERSNDLEEELHNFVSEDFKITMINLSEKKLATKEAQEREDYYAAASFCFSLNIAFQYELYLAKNLSLELLIHEAETLEKNIALTREEIEQEKIDTISDLQTKIIVKERLDDTDQLLQQFLENNNNTYALAYAKERLYSAFAWSEFFQMEGKKFSFDNGLLRKGCLSKIAESNERFNYAAVYLPREQISYISDKITQSRILLENEDYELCLARASQAKAEASSILSSLGLTNSIFDTFLEHKGEAVEKIIAKHSNDNIFPILGYSYYQYAQSLRDKEPFSALLYFEYALELSDLDSYFPEKHDSSNGKKFNFLPNKTFIFGFIIGMLVALGIVFYINYSHYKRLNNHN